MEEALEPTEVLVLPAVALVPETEDPVMTTDEEAALERSLRSLGYIE